MAHRYLLLKKPKETQKKASGPVTIHRSKLLLRASHYFLRMFSLLAEDLTDTFTQNIFTVNNSTAWKILANIILPFFSALIWIVMAFQDATAFSYSIASKPKRIALLALSIIGAVTGILVVVFSFISLSIGAIVGASLFIALGAAISALRSGFYLYLSWRKTTPLNLLKDRRNNIEKLQKHSAIQTFLEKQHCAPADIKKIKQLHHDSYLEEKPSIGLEKLLRLSLQESALCAVNENRAEDWQRCLAEDIQLYQKEKIKEHAIEFALTSMVAVGSFLLLVPVTNAIGGAIIIATALISLLFASIRFCQKSFKQWDNRRQIKLIWPLEYNDAFSLLKKVYLNDRKLKAPEERENYWLGLPKSVQHEKCIQAIPLLNISNRPAENRGKLIMLWYRDQLLDLPKRIQTNAGAKIIWHILKESLLFLIKKIFFIALIIPILAVAAVYGGMDSKKNNLKKIAPYQLNDTLFNKTAQKDRRPLLALAAPVGQLRK